MQTLTRFLIALPLLAALTAAPALRAAAPKPSPDIVTASPAPEPPRPLTFNVDFPGGAVSLLIDAIAKTDGASLSLVARDQTTDFSRIELPAFTLRNVQLITVVGVLGQFLEPRGYIVRPMDGINANTVVCMLSRMPPPAHPNGISPNEFMSFQLAPYLPVQSVDEIVSAIRAGWELDPAHDRDALKLKFHPSTSILLVAGPADAIPLTQSIINSLKRGPAQSENK